MRDSATLNAAKDRLIARLSLEERVLIAFSGGADSALLAYTATQVLGNRALAVTAVSASLPASERIAAAEFARSHGIAHIEVCTDEMSNPDYIANDGNRCFHCKTALFDALEPMAALMNARMALGTNLDDLGDHRPGQAAGRLRGAIAPMVDAGLSKADVREISASYGLTTATKPAAACLSSRIAYGDSVTPATLARIEQAEETLKRLGFRNFRVRAHADGTLARLEMPQSDMDEAFRFRDEIRAELRSAGFLFVSLDLGEFRSGAMNALLPLTTVIR